MDRIKTTALTGAEIVVRCLQEEGVEYVFGYPGGAVLFIYDELFKQDKVKHVLVRHEQGAAHAADGYSRSSRKVGVALVTSGPGVTNAVTGIATAYMDAIPMVVITGQVPTHAIGLDAFQECDTVGITRPIVKHNMLVKDVKDLASAMKKAFHIATTGRPGPVVVDIPKDVTQAQCEFVYPDEVSMRSYNPVRKGHAGQIKKAAQLLLEAKRPMVYTGGGVVLSNSSAQLKDLIKQLGVPVTNTLMGLGAYPATDPQFVLEKLYEVTQGDAFVTSDVGQHQMWAAQFYKFDQPRRWINSGGLGTMGFGLPAAMGAQLANPGATVACVTGESSIQMCLQELSTCKQYRLPIKIVNLNNKYMGMVRQWQQFFHGNRYSESYMDALPDFVKVTEGYGHRGMLIEKPADVEPALKEAFSRKDELGFLDFITDQAENVYPMVQGGKGLTEMILAEEL